MENQSTLKENLQGKHSAVIWIKFIIILGLTFSIAMFLLLIFYNPTEFLKITPQDILLFMSFVWGPLLMIIGLSSYITRMLNLSRIPLNSSLYDAIMLPTIQYGQLKIFLPVIEEEDISDGK